MQFQNIACMNNWSNDEKACVMTLMLRDSATAILENVSSSAELLHGQLHNRTQQAEEDLTTFVYEVQSLAKRATSAVSSSHRNMSLLASL
nr:unnamed protein product [Callosobruchus chinensis]